MAKSGRQVVKKPAESETEDEEYEVECIVNHKINHRSKNKKILQYYIKWKGYDSDENTWEPEDAVDHATELVEQYWQQQGPAVRLKVDQELGRAASTATHKVAADNNTTSAKRKQSNPDASSTTKKAKNYIDEGEESNEPVSYYESETELDFSDTEVEDSKFRLNSSWVDVTKVEAVRPADDNKTLYAIVRWNDGKLARYKTGVVAKKAPLKLIDYYEKRLLFERIH